MKWLSVLGILCLLCIMILLQWPKVKRSGKKESLAFIVLIMLGGGLALLLLFFPDMPGPTSFIQYVFKPISKILE